MQTWFMARKQKREHPELKASELIRELPLALANEAAAVAFLEKQRWGGEPKCAHCESPQVYQMLDAATGQRNQRFLWRCRSCKKQFTVRVGTIFESSHLALRHWCYAFWRSCSSKKGVAALELKRHCQITYRAALFMLHRIRWGMALLPSQGPLLDEIVEADETYVGGKPRKKGVSKRGRGTKKIPVFAVVQRHGPVRVQVVASVNGATLKGAIRAMVAPTATILTDDLNSYRGIGKDFDGGHHSVNHSAKQYSRPWPDPPKAARGANLHTNTIEGFFSLIKRGIMGIYHNVSPKHLHRYMAEFAWRYNVRKLNDGDRTIAAIQSSIGKRLLYREPIGSAPSN